MTQPEIHSISKKILFRILFFSFFVTLSITCIQILFDYNQGKKDIKSNISLVMNNYYQTLVNSAWNFDNTTIKLIFDAMARVPDILYIKYPEQNIEIGQLEKKPEKIEEQVLVYVDAVGAKHPLGSIQVAVTYSHLYAKIMNKIVVILVTQAVKTFLVSFFILFIVERLVIFPLKQLGEYIAKLDVRVPVDDLSIHQKHQDDELGLIVSHVNAGKNNLRKYYTQLQHINKNLEKIVEKRTAEVKEKTSLLERSRHEKERLAGLGKIVSGVAHEIRNPMNIITNVPTFFKGGHEIILGLKPSIDDEKIQKKIKKYEKDYDFGLTTFQKNIDRLTGILQSMAMLNRGFTEDFSRLNLKKYMLAMIDKVKNELDFKGIEVETQLDEIGEVEIIPNELTYAFKQILQNSIQVLREKKEMNPEFRPKIRISLKEVEKGCRVSIFDNGTGIADELKEKVFDPFFTTKMPNKHRGLGLSVASSIIKLHLGDIKLNSIQDESLEIMIDLPSKNFDSEGTQFI